MTSSRQARPLTCARCGAAFDCRPEGGCWCADEVFRMPLDAAAVAEGCLCPACLRKAAAEAGKRRVG
ncbi:MAG TPA: cysteine-rich CWC family protein [Pseudolabrys sp.]|nr:cysteine-rich CWC family protein [Pseudolabrys sp.]